MLFISLKLIKLLLIIIYLFPVILTYIILSLLIILLSLLYISLFTIISIIKNQWLLYNIKKNKYHDCNDDCSICLEPLKNNIIITKCNHIFHNKCIELMINNRHNKCPLCRRKL